MGHQLVMKNVLMEMEMQEFITTTDRAVLIHKLNIEPIALNRLPHLHRQLLQLQPQHRPRHQHAQHLVHQ
jgi:hypothetical protein